MRRTYRTLYRLSVLPWELDEIPAPLLDIVEGPDALPPARAADLGCGTGRQARYLAEHGWSVTAVDYTPEAITAARRRDPTGQVRWRVADVTEPSAVDPDARLAGATTLLLDNGCLHGIPPHHQPGWAATVGRLAAPRAALLVRAAPRRGRGVGPRGIDADGIAALLTDRWRLDAVPGPHWYRYTLVLPEDAQPPPAGLGFPEAPWTAGPTAPKPTPPHSPRRNRPRLTHRGDPDRTRAALPGATPPEDRRAGAD